MFNKKPKQDGKYLEIDAGMKGALEFKDFVRLKISAGFDGNLSMKGILVIGEDAVVNATIEGDSIVIFGSFSGELIANKEVRLMKTSRVNADITARSVFIEEGACFDGKCSMLKEGAAVSHETKSGIEEDEYFEIDELSNYLEIDKTQILDWVKSGKIPCITEGDTIKFRRQDIDKWVEDNILR